MLTRTRSCAAVLLLFAACSYSTSATKDASPGEPVQLAIDEIVRVTGTDITVRFVSASDSRCPSDVTCVQAGDAAVGLIFAGSGGQRSESLYLRAQPNSAVFGAHTFQVVDVLPYPKSTEQRPNLVLTLRITKN